MSKRWKNISSLLSYAAALAQNQAPVEWEETLTPEQMELEKWMLGLRLSDGFPDSWVDSSRRVAKCRELESHGLLMRHAEKPGYWRLTPRGFALSDQIIAELA